MLLVGCGGGSHAHDRRDGAIAVTADLSRCGGPWPAQGGPVTFAVTNRFREAMDVYLVAPASRKVYAEWEGLGPGATQRAGAVLGDGSYRLECFPADEPGVAGPTVTIDGAGAVADPTPGVVPVTDADLIGPSKAYQAWVSGRLPVLRGQVGALARAVGAGPTARAKAAWLEAHLTYETLGAAYDAFGAEGEAVEGGFHEVEALLWSGAAARRLTPAVARLGGDLARLDRQFATTAIEPNVIALRAHEIVENAIEFELNGTTDAGSHTNLATVAANLAGSAKALGFVEPLLESRYPRLPETRRALASSQRLLAGYDHAGKWTPLDSLSRREREDLNASLEHLVELLAPVAAICDVRLEPLR